MKRMIAILLVWMLTVSFAFGVCAEEKTLTFTTTDLNGNTVDESILEGHTLILFNVWEPWCGYCVKEMPGLEEMYRRYKDDGLLIIGLVNRCPSKGLDPEDTIRETGITYPVLNFCEAFDGICPEESFPASFFTDGEGHILDTRFLFRDSALADARTDIEAYAAGSFDLYLDDPAFAQYRPWFELLKNAAEGGEAELTALADFYLEDRYYGSDAFYGFLSDRDWEYFIQTLFNNSRQAG